MIKNRLSGTFWPIFWFVVFGYFAFSLIGSIFITNQEAARNNLEDGEVYGKNGSGNLALKVLNIAETRIRVDDQIFYVVETDDRIVLLESSINDEDLKYILDNKYRLEEGGYYLAVEVVPETERRKSGRYSRRTVYNITPELLRDVEEDIKYDFEVNKMKKNNKELVRTEYVSLYRYKNGINFSFWFGIVMLTISAGILAYIYYKVKTNIREYRELDEAYPELAGDFSAIRDYAEFKDEKLKLIVYKGSLITYYKGFSITKLSDIRSIDIVEEVNGRFEFLNYTIRLKYFYGESEKWRIKKVRKKTREHLNVFKEFMSEKYPDLKIKIINTKRGK